MSEQTSNSEGPLIAVTGATGIFGHPTISALIERGARVRAFSRDPEAARPVLSARVEIVRVELDDEASMRAGLADADGMFLVVPIHAEMVRWGKRLVACAAEAGVEHIARISAPSATLESPFLHARMHAELDLALERSDVAYTIIRPYFRFQNLLMHAASVANDGVLASLFGQQKPLAMIDARDAAEFTAVTMVDRRHDGCTYELSGRRPVTYQEIAVELSRLLGHPVRYVPVTRDEFRAALVSFGEPQWLADDIALLAEQGDFSEVRDTFERVMGRPPTALVTFLEDHIHAFGRDRADEFAVRHHADTYAKRLQPETASTPTPR